MSSGDLSERNSYKIRTKLNQVITSRAQSGSTIEDTSNNSVVSGGDASVIRDFLYRSLPFFKYNGLSLCSSLRLLITLHAYKVV